MSWQHFLSHFSSSTPISRIWTLVRRLTGKRAVSNIPVLRIPGNPVPISESREVINVIAQTIAQNSSNANSTAEFILASEQRFNLSEEVFRSTHEEYYNDIFSLCEMKAAISSSGNTSVGPDQLHYAFFRHLSDGSLRYILQTFNDIWQKHVFP